MGERGDGRRGGVEQGVVFCVEVDEKSAWNTCVDGPLMRYLFLEGYGERCGGGQDEQDVPVDIPCQKLGGGEGAGGDDPADYAGYDEWF